MDKEREAVGNACKELIMEVLWNPNTNEGHSETSEHELTCWKSNGTVQLVIRKTR